MSELLPVLRENHPAMSLCTWCPMPGSCCKKFTLTSKSKECYGSNFSFWKGSAQQDAQKELDRRGLPFIPAGISVEGNTRRGHRFVQLEYDCPHLQADGRCGIYATRPDVCRSFIPGTNDLCCVKLYPGDTAKRRKI
jgi:Fe-S-cluster containining protein